MDKKTAAEIDVSAILSTYVYMDEQNSDYTNKSLDWILKHMPDTVQKTSEYKAVKNAVKENPELGKMTLVSQSMCEGDKNNPFCDENGMFSDELIIACAFQDPNGNIYVAYRGTGDGKWVDNGIGIANKSSQMQQASNAYYDHVVESLHLNTNPHGKVIVTGHSKGGNEAQYVTLNSKYGYLIDNCYSIDGQGFSQEAIDHFIDKYGKGYYLRQLEKMYSINGENDFVHDLGIVVIPENHTYFIETPEANSLGEYHDILKMLNGAGLNWKTENGEIISVEQGPIGEFVKALSKRMKYLDQEDLEDCAITIMSIIEFFLPYNDELGGEYKIGTGDRSFMTAEEFIGFLAHGIPLFVETILLTDEGRGLAIDTVKSGIKSVQEKYGVMGIIALEFVTMTILPQILVGIGAVVVIANIVDFCTDLVHDIADVSEKVKQFFSDVKVLFLNSVNKISAWSRSYTSAYKYATANPEVVVDTYKLRNYGHRIEMINSRITRLDSRLDGLYWSVGLLDLWNLLQADILTGYSWRLQRCSNYLINTAEEFENTEGSIASAQ